MKMNNKCTHDTDIKNQTEMDKPLTKRQVAMVALEVVELAQQLRKDLDELIHIVYRANLNRKIEEKQDHTTNHFGDEMTWEAPTGDYLGIPTIHRFAKEIAKKNSIYPYNKEWHKQIDNLYTHGTGVKSMS